MLNLIDRKKVKFVNCPFFSKIESSPLEVIEEPAEKLASYHYVIVRYLRTVVSFYCREELVAQVTIEGAVSTILRSSDQMLVNWRTTELRARKYYWSNRHEEPREWKEFRPLHKNYGNVRCLNNKDEQLFSNHILNALEQNR